MSIAGSRHHDPRLTSPCPIPTLLIPPHPSPLHPTPHSPSRRRPTVRHPNPLQKEQERLAFEERTILSDMEALKEVQTNGGLGLVATRKCTRWAIRPSSRVMAGA